MEAGDRHYPLTLPSGRKCVETLGIVWVMGYLPFALPVEVWGVERR